MNTLEKILNDKKLELEYTKRRTPLRDLKFKVKDTEVAVPFFHHFDDGINIIAEVKAKSPSAGSFFDEYDPQKIARIYKRGGAKAISILTDERYFGGSLNDLAQVKKIVTLPVLRKDFTIEEYQIYEARSAGADAVLLIVAALDAFQLKDYQALTEDLGMVALVEVHHKSEMQTALTMPLKALGINNRDLKTLKTDLATSVGLVKKIPSVHDFKLIAESGLNRPNDLISFKNIGFDGFLIGESLLKSSDILTKLREFIHGNSV
jgi:indole-3-glycerol phosphate synthase